MPLSDMHKKKMTKNLTILAAIMGWVAVIWIITMIKIKAGMQ
ncbi:hypothetical protein [Micavibrio aeruginosavorus]|uniref:Uncharacterized protein n=2 Tax=Micavibrio aeruginosavorus TaxID=349221 RepID=G2KQ50_MICAA|nr:hypothetical protein [Micavibrio aeruginosavorus]AEP08592.1 hypothetical protein MICA_246 [Micavibrio aeruginosavorus ARL-13]AGH97077.1 hypothetical protein A11S_241 [Micavibrio aeruginosavorus EPB]